MGNAIYRKGTGTSVQLAYQKWQQYPDSPLDNSEMAYQCIVNFYDVGEIKLYLSPSPIEASPFFDGISSGVYLGSGGGRIYRLIENIWEYDAYYPSGAYGTEVVLSVNGNDVAYFSEANNNIEEGVS